MNISPEQFVQMLQKQAAETEALMKQIPAIAGVEAVNHFKENFQIEGFDEPNAWQEVKRRQNPTRPDHAAASRKILTGETGNLGRSIQYEAQEGQATVFSDVVYADAHNEGTNTAGRNRNISIPKRQFIGESKKLDEKIEKEIERRLGLIL
jgi:phage gpG-like protein